MGRCKKESKVVAYSLSGKLYKIYDSAKEASLSFGHRRTVDKCLRGENLTAFNLQWKRLKKKKRVTVSNPIALIDENGNIIKKYPSIKRAALENNVDPHSIRNVLSGKYKFAKGSRYKKL